MTALSHPHPTLLLYTRRGCCLCEGLEERLRQLDPAPALQTLDIDADPELRARYDLLVPVLALLTAEGQPRLLPRVPPRLDGARLQAWVQQHISP